MPAAVGGWAAVTAWWGGLSVWATAAIKLAAVVAFEYGSSKYQAKQMKNDTRFAARDFNVRSATEPEMVVYGQAWVAGPVMYSNARHTPISKDNFEIYIAIVHAAHECDEIYDIRYDNDLLRAGIEIDWTDGRVEAGKYGVSRGGVYAVNLEKHLGTSSQAVSDMLNIAFAGDFTSSHQARGRAYTVHQFNYFSSTTLKPEDLFYAGPPSNIRALVKGKKVYDPRLDSTVTGGSGSHRIYTPSTWAWSDNPVLCAADYMTQYVPGIYAASEAKMDWPWIIAEANKCDTLVVVPPATSPTTKQKRFTCNGVISLGATRKQALDDILSSCMGTRSKVNGKWRITVGGYATPDVTLTDEDIVGDVAFIGSLSKSDRYNTITGTYIADSDYASELEFLPVTSSTYVARDNGEVLQKTIRLPMTNNEYQAQRIAYKHLLQGDNMKVIEVPLRWTGLLLHEGCGVSLTYPKLGFSSKAFRCIDLKIGNENAPVIATLREDSSAAWADPAIGEYSTRDDQGVVTLGTVSLTHRAVTGRLPWVEDLDDNSLMRVQSEWLPVTQDGEGSTPGVQSIVVASGTKPSMGGDYVWRFGDNSGDDEVFLYYRPGRSFAIELNVLYKITFHLRRHTGSAGNYCSLGIRAWGGDRETALVCATNGGLNHWFINSGNIFDPGNSNWFTKTAYFMNDGSSTGDDNQAGTIADPGLLVSTTRYVSPMFIVGSNNQAGIWEISYMALERGVDV